MNTPRSYRPRRLSPLFCWLLLLVASLRVLAVAPGQLEDFQSDTGGWAAGAPHPVPPSILPDAGPEGVGDAVLRVVALGGAGAGSMLAVFNRTEWAGDYLSSGVTALTLALNNPGAQPLDIRVALTGAGASWASVNPFALPADGAWYEVQFGLGASELTRVAGVADHATSLQAVTELRVLHNPNPDFRGAPVAGTLLVGTVTAVPEPGTATLVLLGGAVLLLSRRRTERG